MPRIYDGAKHADMLDEKTKLEAKLQEVAVKMNEEYESDAWAGDDGPAKLVRYSALERRHSQLTNEISLLNHEIARMEDIRPRSTAEQRSNIVADIARRWMAGGVDLLDEGERQVFIQPIEDQAALTMIQRLGGQSGNVFDPYALSRARMAADDPSRSDIDAPSAGTARDAMGLAAPETWASGLVEHLQYYGAVARNCHNFTTANGNDFHQNQLDTTDQEGAGLYDQSQTVDQGVPDPDGAGLGNITDIVYKSFWRHSKFIDVRIEVFDDVHFDAAGRTMREMARRLGRGWNRWFTSGTNANQPQGIVPSALVVVGKAGTIGTSSGVGYDELLDLEYGIDRAYREMEEGGDGGFTDAHGGMLGFMMHEKIEKQLRKLVHPTSKLPVWVPNIEVGVAAQWHPGRIFGKYPYAINQHMQDGDTDNDIPILFGACGHFAVRNIGGPMYYRFWDSKTVERMAVRFIAFSRRDSRSRGPNGAAGGANAGKNLAYCALQVNKP